jgi:hypothetical protein
MGAKNPNQNITVFSSGDGTPRIYPTSIDDALKSQFQYYCAYYCIRQKFKDLKCMCPSPDGAHHVLHRINCNPFNNQYE